MNKLQLFSNQEFGEIRAVELDGRPYAVGVDIARALEYAKPSQAVIDHCKGIRKLGIPSGGGIQETNVISEGDIYRLIIKAADQSRSADIKEKATKFERWIFDEVLPSIKRNGFYVDGQISNDNLKLLQRAINDLIDTREKLENTKKECTLLCEKNETLEIALNTSMKYYTVAKYNKTFGMGWNLEQCKSIGKKLSAYCRVRGIEIKMCETNDERFGAVNSYPITVWDDFMECE